MAPTVYEKAVAERQTIRDHLNLLQVELDDHIVTPLLQPQASTYLHQSEELTKQLSENHKTMWVSAPGGTDMDPVTADFLQLSRRASRLHAGFHGIVMSLPAPAAPAAAAAPCHHPPQHHVRLPRLELPKFSGNLQEWVSFRDSYVNAIHNKTTITKVEKFTHLKSLLSGEAERQVRSLILSEANYDIAWKALQERYENNRELLFSILKRLINQPVINNTSATHLRSLIDTTKECIRSLEVLTIPTQHWDAIIIFLLFSKLDAPSRELWEQSLPDTSVPTLNKMYEFLEQRARALAASSVPATRQQTNTQQQRQPGVRSHHVAPPTCKFGCETAHIYFKCPKFKGLTPAQRVESVKRLKLCLNCLSDGHFAASCSSKHACKTCQAKHHTMLHLEGDKPPVVINHHAHSSQLHTGILATARIQVITATGKNARRSLLDGGATNSHITEKAARNMKLPLRRCNIPMAGLDNSSLGTAKYVTTFSFSPHSNSLVSYTVTALVVKSISGRIPSEKLKREEWLHLQGLQLADPAYDSPDEVDILLGTEIFWTVLENGKIEGGAGQPHAIKSSLGWLVAGPNLASSPVITFTINADLDHQLQRFWEQETIEEEEKQSSEEAACEKHFATTHSRDQSGRFIVALPFKSEDTKSSLGSSRQSAVRRFFSLENKFVHHRNIKDAEKVLQLTSQWKEYVAFMDEYESLSHMSPITDAEKFSSAPAYYIPHHCVIKESSTTTKLRVVFDASARTTTGVSLNECMMVGPTLQDNLADIMMRFRLHPIAFTADIAKMYRQIKVRDEDVHFQRIIWRKDPKLPLQDYKLQTVTYGTSSAPYLAVKCLQQLAHDEMENYPEAAKVALRDFYVDDTASGCKTLQDAKITVTQLMNLCRSGGMELRKWTTNSSELLSFIPEELRETRSLVELQHGDSTVKTLGIFWNPSADHYSFRFSMPPDCTGNTKRTILSIIARIYDPLGWLAPAIIVCKIFMQELWKTTFDWDDVLSAAFQDKWQVIRSSLLDIEKIFIPRHILPSNASRIYLVGCSDASIKAISAAIYICGEFADSTTTCHLLTSKTRVAPVKHVTLPRLELNGAVLLSELLNATLKALQVNFTAVRAFTDSTITLHWIKSNPSRWKIYVLRRVQSIQENVPTAQWYHIRGDCNPADCASRGITAADLHHHPLWWNGTSAFFNVADASSDLLEEDISQMEHEAQQVQVHHQQPVPLHPLLYKFSHFQKLQRVMAYVLRFINNWSRLRRNTPLQEGTLSCHELLTSHNFLIRQLQQNQFPVEYQFLAAKKPIPCNSSLLKLQPFVSEDGLLRVGGRLRNAEQPFDQKHPILLPRGHHITTCIIRDLHLRLLHAGLSATVASLQQQYWVVNARDTVRMVLRKCVSCARHQAVLMNQVMGDLPSDRVNPSPPFSKVGVDYAGPIAFRPMVRSKITLKCWLSIFVCFATRAIHIEVVTSLTTECFLAAFRRFISRRGKPTDVYSDCGTNSKGTDKVLQEFIQLSQKAPVQDECSSQQIRWHFNPAGAPHFGGLWEAGVKSIKYHLKRTMGAAVLTYEEINTLVVQIEGILNSRPLIPASSDPNDLGVLTPAHFLVGRPITAIQEPNLMDIKHHHLKRWQLLQQQQQLFWKRWSSEYLTRLQQRPKWWKSTNNLEVGQLVIIKDERLPPLKWKLGRVISLHPGKDERVRVATLKTAEGELRRPIVKLSLLPISNYESNR